MVYREITPKRDKFRKALKIARVEGLKSFFVKLVLYFLYPLAAYISAIPSSIFFRLKPKKFFFFKGKKFPYFYHIHNTTWGNERIIEVPIVMNYIKESFIKRKRILEVGAVLVHYYPSRWDILDKYERRRKIINKDILDFKPFNKYDLIVSISTFEHVGFDEEIKDPVKIIRAIKNLKENCLEVGGRGVITLPLGYNLEMDKLLFANKLDFDERIFLKRINKENQWIEISEKEAKNSKYNKPFKAANSIVIGIIQN
ncbi:MAG: class I SAM-dependent methyltransferase [Nanoarchaeota archaeon]|nr:class I SAM-dependent methyltransferase [Nanoarchaeota archaeon]